MKQRLIRTDRVVKPSRFDLWPVQRTTKMIASASGKPMARAPAIVMVNAATRFTSGRTLSTDIPLSPTRGN